MFTGQTAHTFTFCAHHQRHRAGHFALIQGVGRFTGGAHNPDALFLQHTHGTRQVGYTDKRYAFGSATSYFFRRRIQLRRTVFRDDNRVHASGVSATQAGAEVVRVGHAIEDQQERTIERSDQIRQIVFLILTARLHARDNALVHGTFAFLIQELTVRQLNHHALRFERMDQRHQALIVAAFQNKNFLKTFRRALQQCLHCVDAVNHFTHEYTRC